MSETVVLGNAPTALSGECVTVLPAGMEKKDYLMKIKDKIYYYKGKRKESRLAQCFTLFINPDQELS